MALAANTGKLQQDSQDLCNRGITIRCQIIPNKLLLQLAKEKAKNPTEKRRFLQNINRSITDRYKRSVIYNNRELFLAAISQLQRSTGAYERLWFYDCGHTWNTPASPIATIEQKHTDKDQQDIPVGPEYYNLDETYDYFRDVHKRRSFDKKSATVRYYANFGERYNNAFWDGEQLVFGAGDGQYFNNFAGYIDIVAHEFAHAVTQYSADLIYHGQPGALNESISDVFGILIKQRILGNQLPDESDWLIGAGVFNTGTLGAKYKALRSMAHPGSAYPGDDQPDHMSKYVETADDNGGVHINSGIPNKAFYHVASAFGSGGSPEAARIWYTALEDQRAVKPESDFKDFARATVRIAKRLYKDIGVDNVTDAWKMVGVL
jgi:Zn-dependent metalloprotease